MGRCSQPRLHISILRGGSGGTRGAGATKHLQGRPSSYTRRTRECGTGAAVATLSRRGARDREIILQFEDGVNRERVGVLCAKGGGYQFGESRTYLRLPPINSFRFRVSAIPFPLREWERARRGAEEESIGLKHLPPPSASYSEYTGSHDSVNF